MDDVDTGQPRATGAVRRTRAAGVIALVWVGLYLGLIVTQRGGNEDAAVVGAFAAVVGIAGVLLVRTSPDEPGDRRWLSVSAVVLGLAGLLGILSIGLPLLIAAALAASALIATR